MPRYIDADELKESLKNLKAEGNNLKYVQGLQDAIDGYFPQIIDDAPTADVQPVKHDTELSSILQDYGIKDTDTLRYILDQYQKIIVEITGGILSKLVYPAKTVIAYACVDERYRKYYEEKYGQWISVEDRLPELYEKVLTIDNDGEIFINWRNYTDGVDSYFAYGRARVTHWIPLPELPKEVENETD